MELSSYHIYFIIIATFLFFLLFIFYKVHIFFEKRRKGKKLQLSEGKNTPLQLYSMAITSFNNGDFDNAILLLQEIIKINPNFPEPYCTLGLTYAEIGQHHEAIKAFRLALQRMPKCPEAYFNLAISYFNDRGQNCRHEPI
ncbi:MAG: tetratricopeptide repeat protein [Desulfobaccales bacterium]|nr:tetratricopeptide repeat protein [Desulfobaccales bacterium]